ncbi:hypothetical protein [Pseudoalteromonas sp. NGC95]|uniref:hypothetical protein n=1 Tax=Pseudoalteromonas sp. NGC95 TaxID=2792051 RepID=UPI0018CFA0B8|nr:hypothetical protein [Pseudoalteromonas sp. NGC95]MBH0017435.1 hypothetical protein [Pseudoalteromonas sp. NGC95]
MFYLHVTHLNKLKWLKQPRPILIEKSDLELLKSSAAQWESSQPKVEQLLKLENKLTQLATNLKQLNESDVLNTRVNDVVNNESILKTDSALFALQIAAFKNKNALQKKLSEFQKKYHKISSYPLR